jgi:hypothetical protein
MAKAREMVFQAPSCAIARHAPRRAISATALCGIFSTPYPGLREAAFGTRELIRVDMRLDKLPRTGGERATVLHHAPHGLARDVFGNIATSLRRC